MALERALLDDEREIERVALDYVAAIDQRDYALLRSVLSDEVSIRFRPEGADVHFTGLPEGLVLSAESYVERNRILFVGFAGTHHQLTNLRIDVQGDAARARAYLQATHFLPGERDEYSFGAFYDNTLTRTRQGWKFTRIDLTVTWERGDHTMIERSRAVGLAQ
jgi:hypothetical protein